MLHNRTDWHPHWSLLIHLKRIIMTLNEWFDKSGMFKGVMIGCAFVISCRCSMAIPEIALKAVKIEQKLDKLIKERSENSKYPTTNFP